MEKVSSFTYCDKVQMVNTPNGPARQIINPIQELTPIAFPSNYSFAIAYTISDIEPNDNNHLKVTFESPEHVILEELKIEKCTPPADIIEPGKLYSLQIDSEIHNTVLEKPGDYLTRIIFNDKEIGQYKIKAHPNSSKEN